jgi:DNA polymerase-3 subunit epsilon
MGSPWHLGTLLAVDTETTGVNPEEDRIVTACTAWVDGSGKTPPQVKTWLAWPGIDIPEAAAKIHGITTGEAYEHGLPAVQVADEVASMVLEACGSGIPVVAFNAPFDLTLIDRECRRHGLDPVGPSLGLVIDPWVLDKAMDRYRKGGRTLGDVAVHYGVTVEGAHSADGDALAAARVAWKIAARYPRLAEMGAEQLVVFQRAARAEQARSLAGYLRGQGKAAEADQVDGSWPWRPVAAEEAA